MIATSGKHLYKMCVKSTTRKEKLTTKNEDRNVTNANCNSLYILVTMIISVSDNKRQIYNIYIYILRRISNYCKVLWMVGEGEWNSLGFFVLWRL